LQRPSLRHRYTLGGAGAEADGGDGDLLKAIRWATRRHGQMIIVMLSLMTVMLPLAGVSVHRMLPAYM
jgi:hypothetical protein